MILLQGISCLGFEGSISCLFCGGTQRKPLMFEGFWRHTDVGAPFAWYPKVLVVGNKQRLSTGRQHIHSGSATLVRPMDSGEFPYHHGSKLLSCSPCLSGSQAEWHEKGRTQPRQSPNTPKGETSCTKTYLLVLSKEWPSLCLE